MWERLLVIAIAIGGLLAYDGVTLRKKLSKRDKGVYAILLAASLYMGIDYIVNRDWLDVYDIVEVVFGQAAKQVESALSVEW